MSKSDINVTYLPITDSPTERVPAADWVLSHYDFARAKMLMHLLDKTYVNGPYVLSTLVALSMQSRPPEHFLFQDMSSVPGEVAVLWEQEFQDAQHRRTFGHRRHAIKQSFNYAHLSPMLLLHFPMLTSGFHIKTSVAAWISWK